MGGMLLKDKRGRKDEGRRGRGIHRTHSSAVSEK